MYEHRGLCMHHTNKLNPKQHAQQYLLQMALMFYFSQSSTSNGDLLQS